ncbi:diguanylate cyclase [Marinospirillum alkaliphilum]|uniref:diguanylate cyclase n=1 Tax=Marinospirillum alkaliphilum DSM 21637 TaxID=1122209 RepID=A0A1K1V2V6_9GAMM|nr:diguanylate cyclase [Marinospirillum alkaliphilum]SFX19099.1 diguanylate cyclase (GGDEF) domain-containing protein [Marinospirillum alkaliphilum DSM 21637]
MRERLLKVIHSPWCLLLPLPFWALVVGFLYLQNSSTLQDAGYEMARQRGEVAFHLVQTLRYWNAQHGGVYAPLTETTPENPYLDIPEKTIVSPSGMALTKLNPAYMTRQVAELMRGSSLEINLTSDQLMNPNNQPDAWESQALNRLKNQALSEYVEVVGDRFRYMAPLYMEQGCMACHAHMGYQLGDFRGGLSVSFPVSYVKRLTNDLHRESRQTHLLAFLLLCITGSLAIYGLQRLLKYLQLERSQRESIIEQRTASLHQEINRHRESQERLRFLAHHDELTGVANRRRILQELQRLMLQQELQPERHLALLMLDIDHFKRVNDTHGHDVGDTVLKGFVKTLQHELRRDDLLGRYGGEEFLILLPDTQMNQAWQVAERLRLAVEAASYQHDELELKITTSLGIALYAVQDNISQDELINRADTALYQAKREGRNCCVIWQASASD